MSAAPVPISTNKQLTAGEAQKLQLKRQARRSDLLYIAGAALVTAGVGLVKLKFAPIAAGAFCLLPPLLELAIGFVRGVRATAKR